MIFNKGCLKNVYFEEERMIFLYRYFFNNKKNKIFVLVEWNINGEKFLVIIILVFYLIEIL